MSRRAPISGPLPGALLALALTACGPRPAPAPPPAPVADPAPARPATPAPPPRPPAAYIADARRAAAAGDTTRARDAYRQALTAAPDDPAIHYDLGVLAERDGRADAARGHYQDALRAEPTFGPAVITLGRLAIRSGDPGAALALASGQLARHPQSADLKNALNRLRIDADRDIDRVEADSKAVLRDDEQNVAAMINLAAAYHRDGRHELAIAILDNARALAPDDPEILARKALAHQALGEDLKARFTLEEATAIQGGASAEIHNNLGLVYHAAGDYPGAEAQFRKALARAPGLLAARINLGNALKGQQRYTDADAVLTAALRDAPRDPDLLYNLGILYLDGQIDGIDPADRLTRALAFFERYTQTGARTPDDPVGDYIEEARKRIEVERKRAEQRRATPKAPPPAATPAAPPAEPAPTTPPPAPAPAPAIDPDDEK